MTVSQNETSRHLPPPGLARESGQELEAELDAKGRSWKFVPDLGVKLYFTGA